MIKLYSGSIAIKRENGIKDLYDLDNLKDALWESFIELNIDDPELVEDIITVIHEFSKQHSDLNEQIINDLVIRILNDTGFRHVASHFASSVKGQTRELSEKQSIPGHEDLVNCLQNEPFFIACDTKQLAELTLEKVHLLGFESVSKDFILELAKTIWLNSNQPEILQENDYWLLKKSEIMDLCNEEQRRLFHSQQVACRSISRLFPRIHLRLNLLTIVSDSEPLLTELAMLPKIDFCLKKTAEINQLISTELAISCKLLSIDFLKTQVYIHGLKELSHKSFGDDLLTEKKLMGDIQGLVLDHFPPSTTRIDFD